MNADGCIHNETEQCAIKNIRYQLLLFDSMHSLSVRMIRTLECSLGSRGFESRPIENDLHTMQYNTRLLKINKLTQTQLKQMTGVRVSRCKCNSVNERSCEGDGTCNYHRPSSFSVMVTFGISSCECSKHA